MDHYIKKLAKKVLEIEFRSLVIKFDQLLDMIYKIKVITKIAKNIYTEKIKILINAHLFTFCTFQ